MSNPSACCWSYSWSYCARARARQRRGPPPYQTQPASRPRTPLLRRRRARWRYPLPSTTIRGSVLFSLARFAASQSLALRSPSSTGTTATRAGLPRAKAAARSASRFAMQDTWFRTRAAPVSSATAAPAPVRFAGCSVRRSRRDVREVTTSRYRPRLLPTALEPTRRPYLRCESLRPRRSSRASGRERQAPSASRAPSAPSSCARWQRQASSRRSSRRIHGS
mmetsp:Transcript_16421/g.40658  ORF Transcript_16421/g.40658 Transcript_16421/m.40658 type:complete len:222 (+) Transcript_16421:307-972(+)